ncbi:hypothetical protein [Candidatus Vidania fulgoroideorum]
MWEGSLSFILAMSKLSKGIGMSLYKNIVIKEDGRSICYMGGDFRLAKGLNVCVINGMMHIASSQYKKNHPIIGTYIALLNSFLYGRRYGYSRTFELHGNGMFIKIDRNMVHINVGYSHIVNMVIPSSISIVKEVSGVYIVRSYSKQELGNFCALLKSIKKFSPYKKKGIIFCDKPFVLKHHKKR